ncbi:hypothetical protein [Caballeronia sp. LZ032]|uniref:hypothetical protein n=1 Tax=Caballeronia sp. LZ032 TaxID=3038565 RepID=UPI002861880A|nr:hypothetical protein [Caballeronia sp. LZ032]MDR5878780.1 hypothetical protein [Caballeronia sp. LZ032]
MEDLLGDDILPTDWDLAVENPPHAGWMARCRIQIYRALQSIEASINRNEGRQ